MTFLLFAETTTSTVTVTPSGNFSDPNSWVGFVEKTGIPAFYGTLIILGVGFLVWKFGWFTVTSLLGENGWVAKFWKRLDEFLVNVEKNSTMLAKAQSEQSTFCQQIHLAGGSSNVDDLRSVGHDFAEMGRKIGEKVGADVNKNADDIHEKLRK